MRPRKKAQTTADGKNLIYRGPDEPSHDGLKPGDMWWRTQKYWTRWKGEKNNSPSLLADFYTYWQGTLRIIRLPCSCRSLTAWWKS